MWIAKFNKPYKEKIKKLTFNFADIKKGETMLVSSPSSIAKYIHKIPKGKKKTVIEMREALAKKAKANKTCPCIYRDFFKNCYRGIIRGTN